MKNMKPSADSDQILQDLIFYLPENMYGNEMKFREMYEHIVHDMMKEARHLPMKTSYWIHLERLAFTYVMLRYRESIEMGQPGGFKHASEQKDLNSFYMSLMQEWNKILKGNDIEERQVLTTEFLEIVQRSLKAVAIGKEEKTLVVNRLAEDLEKAGWSA